MPTSLSANTIRRLAANAFGLALIFLAQPHVHAAPITLDMVTVGNPGNSNDTGGVGAVADAYRIAKYEFTNQQYTDFLNSVAVTDTYSLYNANMGSNARGGITRSGSSGSYSYSVNSNMGDKPVIYVSWFDAARVANWLQNGQGSGSTETGAYTLVGGQTSGTAPARNSGATFYIPTRDEWYKAAYYKGGSTNAGYWEYATQSDTAPTPVTSDATGIGLAGSTGNFANYAGSVNWNSVGGNVTTVGTNGGPSAYGTFDMSGNVVEWNDLAGGAAGSFRWCRGGDFFSDATLMSASSSYAQDPSFEGFSTGFRLAAVAVPEPSTSAMALVGLACGGYSMWRRRKQDACSDRRRQARPCLDHSGEVGVGGCGSGRWSGHFCRIPANSGRNQRWCRIASPPSSVRLRPEPLIRRPSRFAGNRRSCGGLCVSGAIAEPA
jgi:sulfatase modifying factor 1